MAKLVNLTCTWCTKNYTLTNPRYQTKVKKGVKNFYCSRECSVASQRSHVKNNSSCTVCAKMFHRTKSEISKSKSQNIFCSSSCAAKFNNKGLQRNPPKERMCSKCNDSFFRSNDEKSNLCKKCQNNKNTLKNLTLKECKDKLSIKGKHVSWTTTYVRQHNSSYNKSLKKLPCQKCGYSKHVELAHIKPVSSFQDTAFLEEINSSDNILVLCPNCHWEFDSGILLLSDIPSR